MYKEKIRTKETLNFLEWTRKYQSWWLLICGHKRELMNPKMMRILIKKLADESFYEIIFVLLEVYRNEEFIEGAREALLKDLLISEWKSGNSSSIIKKLIAYLE